MKTTTKYASISPVTFVTHKRFAVLIFLSSCRVSSLFSLKLAVEWRRLSRFPAKMTPAHACALLSMDKISCRSGPRFKILRSLMYRETRRWSRGVLHLPVGVSLDFRAKDQPSGVMEAQWGKRSSTGLRNCVPWGPHITSGLKRVSPRANKHNLKGEKFVYHAKPLSKR